jgi:hypothetical protein
VLTAADKTIQWIVLSDERPEHKRRAGRPSHTTPRSAGKSSAGAFAYRHGRAAGRKLRLILGSGDSFFRISRPYPYKDKSSHLIRSVRESGSDNQKIRIQQRGKSTALHFQQLRCGKLCYRILPAINSGILRACNATQRDYLR